MSKKKLTLGILAVLTIAGLVLSSAVIAKPLFGEKREKSFNAETFVPDEIVVKFKGDSEPFRVIKVPQGKVGEKVREFSKRQDVENAEPNYIATTFLVPNDPYYGYQWHLDNAVSGSIQTEGAWDVSDGAGVVVAVIDTGIAYENYGSRYRKAPDLADTCFVAGYDFVNNDNHPNDDNSHGTHVAGTIAQNTNNSNGVAGVAFKSCLMPVKVLNRYGSGTYTNIAKGIRFAADKGAKVINLSLGGSSSSTTLKDATAYAYNKGVTIIAAVGNNGSGTISYPAAYDDYVIAVGATRYDETLASYSNYGSSLDLVAPGGDLNVDQNKDGYGDGVLQNTFNPNTKNTRDFGYWFFQGTSMASPHVAGTAALLLTVPVKCDLDLDGKCSPAEVKTRLEATTKDLGTPGKDSTFGFGLVDAEKAVTQ